MVRGCPTCGQDHDRCHSHNVEGNPCGRRPTRGTTVCFMHGAGAPQVRAAAARRVAEAKTNAAVAAFGLPRDIDPQDALLEEVHRTAGHIAWLGLRIAEFRSDADLIDREGKDASPLVRIYQSERQHLVRVTKACLDAGVAERQVQLAEGQGRQLAEVISGTIAGVFAELLAAGLEADLLARIRRERIPGVIRANLAALATPPEAARSEDGR